MVYATKIKMKNGSESLDDLQEIDSIYLEGVKTDGFYTKEAVHDFLKKGNEAKVKISPYPNLIPVGSGVDRYVKSEPNWTKSDNLLSLPRE